MKLKLLSLVFLILLTSCNSSVPEINPFQIGQTVYFSEKYYSVLNDLGYSRSLAENGVEVVDLTKDLVRVKFTDGSEHFCNWRWIASSKKISLTDKWVLGNPFSVGQTVCVVPSSSWEDIPLKGKVLKVKDDFLVVEGNEKHIHYLHYQECN